VNVIPETGHVTTFDIYVVISSDVDVMICRCNDMWMQHTTIKRNVLKTYKRFGSW